MKRITILFDEEQLYREVKAAAAREGRAVKEVVAEALDEWLTARRGQISLEAQRRRQQALLAADDLRKRLPPAPRPSEEVLREIRDERAGRGNAAAWRTGERWETPAQK